MGGIRTDVSGRTSLARLYAAGEVACTGVHGANRLASNSLLEGLVFGARAAEVMLAEGNASGCPKFEWNKLPESEKGLSPALTKLRQTMWEKAGLLRDGDGLRSALAEIRAISAEIPHQFDRELLELRNLQTVGELIVRSALAREESRGAHYRNDFPKRDDERYAKHSMMRGDAVSFEGD
jgi:L-aspartate oxidase